MTPEAREKIDERPRPSTTSPKRCCASASLAKEGRRFRYEIALEDPRERSDGRPRGRPRRPRPSWSTRISAADLAGATIDLDPAVTGGGLRIDNPNEGWQDPVASAVQEVLDRQINPGVGSHGGMVTLVEVKDGTAYMRFGGGCQGCAAVDVTLKQGVETADPGRGAGHLGDRRRHRPRCGREPVLQPRPLARGDRDCGGHEDGALRRWVRSIAA